MNKNIQNLNNEEKSHKNPFIGGVLSAVIVQAVLLLFIMIALGRFIKINTQDDADFLPVL